jgi:NADH-quinone oxidoreductase subunit K
MSLSRQNKKYTFIHIFMYFLQIMTNFFLFLLSVIGIILNKKSILITIICIELMLLSVNLNFLIFSIYSDDMYGQLFSIFILTVSAAEFSVGIAVVIAYYKVRKDISLLQTSVLKG